MCGLTFVWRSEDNPERHSIMFCFETGLPLAGAYQVGEAGGWLGLEAPVSLPCFLFF